MRLQQRVWKINGKLFSEGDRVFSDLPFDNFTGVIRQITSRYGVLCIDVEYIVNGQTKIRVFHNAESLVRVY